MTFTLTPRFGLPQWSQGSDGPSRTNLNDAFARIDQRAAADDGTIGGTALPTSDVVDGRYAQTVDGPYRRLYRRAGGAWQAVGGNTWSETVYNRADANAATSGVARQTSHPGITNPTLVESWDGSSVRGNRQAIGDLNSGQPGALHVGDTAATVDLTTRGRVYVRTTADGQRGVVASAHGSGAGHLFAAQETGGTIAWYVDGQGRMRAQAPTAFGSATPTAGVSLASVAGSTSAADLYGGGNSVPALRVFGASGDTTPLASITANTLTLGRTGWTGATAAVRAPAITLDGNVTITGQLALPNGTISASDLPGDLTVQALHVTGAANVAGLLTTADIAAADIAAEAVSTLNQIEAHQRQFYTAPVGQGITAFARPPGQYSGTAVQSVRAPMVYVKSVRQDTTIPTTEITIDNNVTMPEDGWMRLDTDLFFTSDIGAAGVETFKVAFRLDLMTTSGTVIRESNNYVNTATADSPERGKSGQNLCHVTEVFPDRLTAGTYRIRLRVVRQGALGGTLDRSIFTVMPVVLHSAIFASS